MHHPNIRQIEGPTAADKTTRVEVPLRRDDGAANVKAFILGPKIT